MALDFTDSVGNLFNRLGKIFNFINQIETYQATTLVTQVDCVADQYENNRDYIPDLQNNLVTAKEAAGDIKTALQTDAQTTLIEMIHADNPQPEKTVEVAIDELIAQMNSGSDTVDQSTVGVSVAAGASNNGDGQCLASVTDGQGRKLENVYAEDIVVTCTADSQPGTGGLTEGSETFVAEGELFIDKLSSDWPGGSGGATTIPVANPGVNASTTQNLLTNGDFEDFTSNAPDNWTIVTGTAGTTVDDETTNFYKGAKALKIIGTAAGERTRIAQQLRSTSSAGDIKPETRYALGFWVRVSAVPSAGTLRVALRDGTTDGATVIGGAHATIDLTGETTSYAFHSVQINTPAALPDNIHLVIEHTVAIDNGKHSLIDHMALVEMTQHENGPLIAIFPGATKFLVEDTFTVTVTNNRAGEIQEFFNRMFNMDELGKLLPSDEYGAETIDDILVSCS